MSIKTQLADAYLVYVNDYITVEKFSQGFGLTEDEALTLISLGRKFHEERALAHKTGEMK